MRTFLITLLASTAAAAPSAARAADLAGPDAPGRVVGLPLRLGVSFGWHWTAADYDVLGERRDDRVPGAGPLFGLRLGLRLDPIVSFELEAGAIAAAVDDGPAWLLPARVGLALRPLDAIVTPLLTLGGGLVAHVGGPGRGDADLLLAASAGVEIALGEIGALRLEGGVFATDAVEATLSWSPVATLGFDFFLWRKRATRADEPPPWEPRPIPVAGCPPGVAAGLCADSDHDGVIDAFDHCPAHAGRRADGCPDPDGDGVVAPRDACPRDRGQAIDWGCPR